jgi:hypothetical protein
MVNKYAEQMTVKLKENTVSSECGNNKILILILSFEIFPNCLELRTSLALTLTVSGDFT